VLHDDRRPIGTEPSVAPTHQRHEDGEEVTTLLGEHVLVALRSGLVRDLLEHPLVDERGEPVRQDVAGYPQVGLDRFEPALPKEHVTHDQQRPPLTDDFQRLSDAAIEMGNAAALHAR
jgi:hypothetical protein